MFASKSVREDLKKATKNRPSGRPDLTGATVYATRFKGLRKKEDILEVMANVTTMDLNELGRMIEKLPV